MIDQREFEYHYGINLKELPSILKGMTYEEKLEYVSSILCDEWHTTESLEFIKHILDIFYKSMK